MIMETSEFSSLEFENWGQIPYQEALDRQLQLLSKIHESNKRGFLVFCTHPPVVTLGRKTEPGDVFDWQGETVEIARGGRATYHGPSQLVVYPIANLNIPGPQRPLHDVQKFLRLFENCIVETLQKIGIQSQGKSLSGTEATGVWVQGRKIASLGLGVKNWISYHGAAINLDHDPTAFKGLNPCGFSSEIMTSVEKELGKKISRKEFSALLKEQILKTL